MFAGILNTACLKADDLPLSLSIAHINPRVAIPSGDLLVLPAPGQLGHGGHDCGVSVDTDLSIGDVERGQLKGS